MSEYGVVRFQDSVSRFATQLRQQGGRFAIDHFGSRLTAFSYLREIRVSYVKLDGSYTRGIEQNKENQVFVRALSRMAHELDIQVIAESVETAEEAQILANLNVDGLQGYHIGKPVHPDL
jgi:EAL domain-containing protein (putative c-di-GMP-specific phosphodiesterase class I)